MNGKLFGALLASPILSVAAVNVAQACTPYGLIGTKATADATELGSCSNDEADDGAGGRIEQFADGYVDWISPDSAAYACWGTNALAWASEYGGSAATGQLDRDLFYYPNDAALGQICEFEIRSGTYAGALTWVANSGAGTTPYHMYGSIGLAWQGQWNEDFTPGAPTGDPYWSGIYQIQTFTYQYITYNSSTGGTCIYSNGLGWGVDGELYEHWSGGACGSPPVPA